MRWAKVLPTSLPYSIMESRSLLPAVCKRNNESVNVLCFIIKRKENANIVVHKKLLYKPEFPIQNPLKQKSNRNKIQMRKTKCKIFKNEIVEF